MQSVQVILPMSTVPIGTLANPAAAADVAGPAFGDVVEQEEGQAGLGRAETDCASAAIWTVPAWVAGLGAMVEVEERGDGLTAPSGRKGGAGAVGPTDGAGPAKPETNVDLPVWSGTTGSARDGRVTIRAEAAAPDGGQEVNGLATRPIREIGLSTDPFAADLPDKGQAEAAEGMAPPQDVGPAPGVSGATPAAGVAGSILPVFSSGNREMQTAARPFFAAAGAGHRHFPASLETEDESGSDPADGAAGVAAPALDERESAVFAASTAEPDPGRTEVAGTPPKAAVPGEGLAAKGLKLGEPGATGTSSGASSAGVGEDIRVLPDDPEAKKAPDLPPNPQLSASALTEKAALRTPAALKPSADGASRTQLGTTMPAGDAPRTLNPGVWERLFSGVMALSPTRTDEVEQAPAMASMLAAAVPSLKTVAPLSVEGSEPDPGQDVPDPQPAASLPVAPSFPKPALPGTGQPRPALELAPIEDARREWMTDAGPQGLVATLPANPGTTNATLSPTAVAPPVPQLAAQIGAALSQSADGATELALSPEELGKVRVRLKPDAANPDRLVVMITFERPETLELFRRHAGELSDAFRSAGYAGADIGFGQQGGGQADPDGREATAGRSLDGVLRPDPAGASSPAPRQDGAASLDLRL